MELMKVELKYAIEGRQNLMFGRTKEVYGECYSTIYVKGYNNESFKTLMQLEKEKEFETEVWEEYNEKGYICKRELFENWYFHHIDNIIVKVRRITPCTTKEVFEKLTPNEIMELYGENFANMFMKGVE